MSATTTQVDLAIIGGGINGAAIARDAAGRGFSVALLEKGDLASQTSQWSTKLVHGGLRYLEQGEVALVRESLTERAILARTASHLVQPLTFLIPQTPGGRPAFILRLGLWLYDCLGGSKDFARSRSFNLARHPVGDVLKDTYRRDGFAYSDARTHDARLVIALATDARERGATILPRTELVRARRQGGLWHLETARPGREEAPTITARALVNATGPYADRFIETVLGQTPPARLRLVRGAHIVVPRIGSHQEALLLQNPDKRVVFAIPHEDAFTLVGTTDVDHDGPPGDPKPSDAEIDYLLAASSAFLEKPLTRDDVLASFAGVRPLIDEGAAKGSEGARKASREYRLFLESPDNAPLLSVYGGKLTTARALAEKAVDQITPHLAPCVKASPAGWTKRALLGGAFSHQARRWQMEEDLAQALPALSPAAIRRLIETHGARTIEILKLDEGDPGPYLAGSLSRREVGYFLREEWAETADDILMRRTHLYLTITPDERAILQGWIDAERT